MDVGVSQDISCITSLKFFLAFLKCQDDLNLKNQNRSRKSVLLETNQNISKTWIRFRNRDHSKNEKNCKNLKLKICEKNDMKTL